jgi:copper(I)-binding protein
VGRAGVRALVAAVATIFLAAASVGAHAAADPLTISGVWAHRGAARLDTAFVYLTLFVKHGEADRLLGATTPVAKSVDLVAPQRVRGRIRIAKVAAIDFTSEAPLVLQPRGPHFILRGLQSRLKPGQTFSITLRFAKAGSRDVTATTFKTALDQGMPQWPKGAKLE